MLARDRQIFGNMLVRHVNPYSTESNIMLNQLQSAAVASGADPATAAQRSYGIVYGMVQRQAAMMAFVDVFRIMAVVFLIILPFIWITKRPRLRKPAGNGPATADTNASPDPAAGAPPPTEVSH
jgi:DHA2 family multidrug resistance protein